MNSSENVLDKLQGVVVNFRTGPKTQHSKECILMFPAIKTAEAAAQLIGRKVAWPVEKRTIRGKIVALHGKNGLVRARFRKGLPGLAHASLTVEIIG